ncbi:hypothetical protein LTS08_002560 [Lithohypha guttulata]|nr:hypothetical protein LTS08_002560 [Lithohypha guttulata]
MAFMRRKSVVYHEDVYTEDFEPQRRRRLSKPNTKSMKDLSSTMTVHTSGKRGSSNASQADLHSLYPNESREALRSKLLASSSDVALTKGHGTGSMVAATAAKYERNSLAYPSQMSPTSSKGLQHSISRLLSFKAPSESHEPGASNPMSKDQYGDFNFGSVSPSASSLEQVAQDSAPPARRTASFTPGMATRATNSQNNLIAVAPLSPPIRVEVMPGDDTDKQAPSIETGEPWTPPPQNNRPVTPMSLEYGHIGRLDLGSLRVVNGSPAPSEISKYSKPMLWSSGVRRNTSSVYESDYGTMRSRKAMSLTPENEMVSALSRPSVQTRDVHGSSTSKVGADSRPRHLFDETVHQGHIGPAKVTETSDATNDMAENYRAELPRSPFMSSSPPQSPGSLPWRTTEPLSSPILSAMSPHSFAAGYDNSDTRSQKADHFVREVPIRSRRSSNLATHTESPQAQHSSPLLPAQIPHRSHSPESFFSAPESSDDGNDHFKSAVELQPNRDRSRSPKKSVHASPLKQVFGAGHFDMQPPNASEWDSGYSSHTSLSIASLTNEAADRDSEALKGALADRHRYDRMNPQIVRKLGQPVSVNIPSPHAAVSPVVAKIENSKASSDLPSSNVIGKDAVAETAVTPIQTKEKQRKRLTKLRRKSGINPVGELVVHRLVSIEGLNIPPVSTTARANLAMRSEAVPELDRTYKTQNHTALDPKASTLSLAQYNPVLRFPSPEPEQDEPRSRRPRSRSRTRGRSLSRPRSWFGWSKDKTIEQKKSSNAVAQEPDLKDLGSVIDLLGTNPYDIAQTRRQTHSPLLRQQSYDRSDSLQRRTTPSNITTTPARPKSMMDDAAASKLSKIRRQSQIERTSQAISRRSFDDRGGIPGKVPHSARLSIDAPPLPPLPKKDEIKKRMSMKSGRELSHSPVPIEETQATEPALTTQEQEEAPPPPPHSPLPSFVDDDGDWKQPEHYPWHIPPPVTTFADYNHTNDGPLHDNFGQEDAPPPPPPHSPCPQDEKEGRSREVSWTAQAEAWRDRKRSASAKLRNSWHARDESTHRARRDSSTWQAPVQYTEAPYEAHKPVLYNNMNEMWHQGQGYDGVSAHAYYPPQRRAYTYDDRYYGNEDNQWPSQVCDGAPDLDHWQQEPYYQQWPISNVANAHQLPRTQTWTDSDQRHYHNQPYRSQQPYDYYGPPRPSSRRYSNEYYNDPMYHPQAPRSHRSRPTSRHSQTRDPRPTSRHSQTHVSRPTSRHSQHSRRSFAEQLHPEPVDVPPAPQFKSAQFPHPGRYSGGLDYDYRQRSHGFADSAGAGAGVGAGYPSGGKQQQHGINRGSWLDMEAYGVDLGDVPAMRAPVRATGLTMIYR